MLVIQLIVVYNTSTEQPNFLNKEREHRGELLDDWDTIRTAVHTYITAVLQIVLVFLLTQARSLLFFVNKEIGVFEDNINRDLRRTVGNVFDDIFQRGFKLVKSKFLKLLAKMNSLEKPLQQIKDTFPDVFTNQELAQLASEVKVNVTGKLKQKGKNVFDHLSKLFGK